MRKAVFVIALAALFATSGPSANANCVLEWVYNYYTDATFTTACGYVDTACGNTYSDGCSTNWRYTEIFIIERRQQMSAHCHDSTRSQSVNVACPDETVTAQARVHIP